MSKRSWLELFGALVVMVVSFFSGYGWARLWEASVVERVPITSESVLVALRGQGFLITQTYLFNQTIKIDHASGSFFKDLFWNQIVSASSIVKVNSGVDLSKLAADDISFENNRLTIVLPAPITYGTQIVGDVTLQNKQGIFKKLFDSDDGYNQALAALQAEAIKNAENSELRQELRKATEEEIVRLIRVIMPQAQTEVRFK